MWGYENLDIEPDGFTLAKGLGGGIPIGALLVNKKANIFNPGDHASTFGGNPFACRAAITVIEEIKRRNLLQNVISKGHQIEDGLSRLANDFPHIIKGRRGMGLLQGIVLQENSIDLKSVTSKAFENGLLVVPAGSNVIRIVPPLTISRNETKQLLKKLYSIFKNF